MAVDRLALAEADPNVTLEADVIARRELERVEARQQAVRFRVVLPIAKDRGVCRTAVLVRDDVFVFDTFLHRLGYATACKSTVDSWEKTGRLVSGHADNNRDDPL